MNVSSRRLNDTIKYHFGKHVHLFNAILRVGHWRIGRIPRNGVSRNSFTHLNISCLFGLGRFKTYLGLALRLGLLRIVQGRRTRADFATSKVGISTPIQACCLGLPRSQSLFACYNNVRAAPQPPKTRFARFYKMDRSCGHYA